MHVAECWPFDSQVGRCPPIASDMRCSHWSILVNYLGFLSCEATMLAQYWGSQYCLSISHTRADILISHERVIDPVEYEVCLLVLVGMRLN